MDLVDIITIFTLPRPKFRWARKSLLIFFRPDAVVFKAGTNVFSSLVKWLAFGIVVGALHSEHLGTAAKVGAGTQGFLSSLEKERGMECLAHGTQTGGWSGGSTNPQ